MTVDICECGGVDELDADGLCRVCSAAPHYRECPCDECVRYWERVCEESERAAAAQRKETDQ